MAFGEEPRPSRLDAVLDLDRRSRRPEPEPDAGVDAGPEPVPEVAPEPSDWQLGLPDEVTEAPGEPDPGLLPAAPVRRILAWAIDGALVAAVGVALPAALIAWGGAPDAQGGALPALGSGLGATLLLCEAFVAVVAFVYATAAHALAGATLGKRFARIRVVGEDGLPPTPAVSAARSFWAIVSLAAFGLGLVPALLPPSRRAFHDLLAGTRVVEGP